MSACLRPSGGSSRLRRTLQGASGEERSESSAWPCPLPGPPGSRRGGASSHHQSPPAVCPVPVTAPPGPQHLLCVLLCALLSPSFTSPTSARSGLSAPTISLHGLPLRVHHPPTCLSTGCHSLLTPPTFCPHPGAALNPQSEPAHTAHPQLLTWSRASPPGRRCLCPRGQGGRPQAESRLGGGVLTSPWLHPSFLGPRLPGQQLPAPHSTSLVCSACWADASC